jgi:Ku70/Ku80 beta-barrel domain
VSSSVSVPLVPIRAQSRRALNECIADGSFRAFLLSGQRLHNVAPASLCAAKACACSPTSRARSSRWNCQQPIPRAGRCEDEDFEAARVEGYKTIDITDFVAYEAIGPIFFAKTYYVGPDKGAEKTYSLLVKAMEDSKLAGIAKFVMRDSNISAPCEYATALSPSSSSTSPMRSAQSTRSRRQGYASLSKS